MSEEYSGENKVSTLISRNITVQGRRTSVRLEPEMWACLKEISDRERCKIHDICTLISMRKKAGTSLTAAIRVFVMLYFRAAATENGHNRAGHGSFMSMLQRAKLPSQSGRFFSVRKQLLEKNGNSFGAWTDSNGQAGNAVFENFMLVEEGASNIAAEG